jgi:2,4-dienoyl-CoA reductase-like NADH-dependent reductase (Old Yellow Enzyme family)
MDRDPLFEPLQFRNLTVKNRLFRANISGRFDYYNGSGTQARINFEERFARGGVGTILASHAPVHIRGRILPNYATIDCDERIPFWRKVGERVHAYDCAYVLQLSHGGRQRDIPGVENDLQKGLSSTNKRESLHGFPSQAMTLAEIKQVTQYFVDGARRAREAGLDGVELHACNGYLITQFLSSAINDRKDDYGGSLENRARFAVEIVRAIRKEIGDDYHMQFKISPVEYNNAFFPWWPKGNGIDDSVQICKWLEEAGVNGFHVSSGSTFPHPRNPAGLFPIKDTIRGYDTMISSGKHTFRNYLIFRTWPFNRLFKWRWETPSRKSGVEGINLADARAVKQAVSVPVLCTGGFQTASIVAGAIERGDCDAVTIGRSLIANNDLVRLWEAGKDRPENPCIYANKCLINQIENPLGCYEESRFESHEAMVREIMSVYAPPPYTAGSDPA